MSNEREITQAFAQLVQAGHMEQVVVTSADGNTKYYAFAPAGSKRSDAQWYAFRMVTVTAEDGSVTQRKCCAPGPCVATDLVGLAYTQD
jgi:hypothetical protein